MAEDHVPSAMLKAEHQKILRVLRVLGRLVEDMASGSPMELEDLGQCVQFFRLFADACHHAKEEELLFPVLEQRGIPRENGPIGMMLYEHTMARGLTRDMGSALDACKRGEANAQDDFTSAARAYIELLTNHIYKEDNVLFAMGDQALRPDDQDKLCSQFCEVQCRAFEGKKREELEKIADDLEGKWPGS